MNLNLEDIKNAEPTNIDPDSLPDTDYIIEDVLKIKDLLKKHRNQVSVPSSRSMSSVRKRTMLGDPAPHGSRSTIRE